MSPDIVEELTAAMGGEPEVTAVLLTCDDRTARHRLTQREIGSMLVVTDGRTVADIATEIISIAGWKADRELPATARLDFDGPKA